MAIDYAAGFLTAAGILIAPTADGTSGQSIVTDGNGNLSFSTIGVSSPLTLTASATTETPLTVEAASGQIANLQECYDGVGALRAAITNDAGYSDSGGQVESEVFGVGASATGGDAVAVGNAPIAGTNSIAIGRAADASGVQSLAIGKSANAATNETMAIGFNAVSTGDKSSAIGRSASATGSLAFAFGYGATATGDETIAMGRAAVADATGAVVIGVLSVANGNSSIVIGRRAEATAANQFVVGSSTFPITSVHVGKGVTNSVPETVAYHATGGSGTDVAGADIAIAGGKGTGTGAGGSVKLQTAPVGITGTAANSLVDAGEFDDDVTAGNTRFLLYDVDNGALQRVSVGAADSGGTGFKVLRIPN